MAGLSQRGPQASSGVVFRVPQAAPCPLRQAWASSRSLRVPVCWWSARKVGGSWSWPDGVCWALSAGCREAGGGEDLFHKACSVSRQLASGINVVAFLPHQEPPVHNRRSPPHEDPSPPTSADSKLRPGCPGGAKQGSPGQQFQSGSQGRNNRPVASGLWLMGRSLSGEALAGWIQATSEAALIGEAVIVWGHGEPRASSLAQPSPGQPTLGSGHLLWLSGL